MIFVATKSDTQARRYQITINNPLPDYNHEKIKELLSSFKSIRYWVMSDEKGIKEETYHTHIFMCFSSGVRFSTIKNKFTTAHIEKAMGSIEENRNYVLKIGKWKDSEKSVSQIPNSQEEHGEIPQEGQGKRTDLIILYDLIKAGLSNYEIIEQCNDYLTKLDTIERVRQTLREEEYKSVFRNLEVTYIFGSTGTGKTRGVMGKYGYTNIARITDYLHPFDLYKGQDVIIFEEFRSSLRISDMLSYLDGYPIDLPCRYINKIACYTKVYLISNISLSQQYQNVQEEELATWKAFLRRIHKVIRYTSEDEYKEYTVQEFFDNDFVELDDTMENPFL